MSEDSASDHLKDRAIRPPEDCHVSKRIHEAHKQLITTVPLSAAFFVRATLCESLKATGRIGFHGDS